MAVDAHLPGAVAAGGVADEPAVVVPGRLDADGMLELGNKGDGGESALAAGGRAHDAVPGDVRNGRGQPFEHEAVAAEAAAEGQARCVLEADRIRDLAF